MGKITEALRKAAQERLERLEKRPITGTSYIVKKVEGSQIDPHIVTYFEPKSPVAEQYRILRTNIQSLNSKKPPKVITISSSIHGEGKTVTSINLAIAMAHDLNNKKILLIDSDLRRGRVSNYLGIKPEKGLSDLLTNGVAIEDTLLSIGINKLVILPSGKPPHNPAELLGSTKMKDLLLHFRDKFDYIILDSPPIIPLTDPGVIGAISDGVIMVVQAGRTQRGIVRHAEDLLNQAQAKILGYVLTNIEYHLPHYIYRYL